MASQLRFLAPFGLKFKNGMVDDAQTDVRHKKILLPFGLTQNPCPPLVFSKCHETTRKQHKQWTAPPNTDFLEHHPNATLIKGWM